MSKNKLILFCGCLLVSFKVSAQVQEFRYNGLADVIFSFPPRGSGGRAFVHDSSNILTINYEGDFTGGTRIGRNFIVNSIGNVGIGTANPNAPLEVVGPIITGTASIDPYHALGDLSFLKTSGKMVIGFNRSGGGGETDFISNPSGGDKGGFAFYNYDNAGNESQLMWIRGDGNVGIGTQNPNGYKLAVNGNIRAHQIKVEIQNWPDYVFEKDYKISSLADLEKFIKINKHLPEIPSSENVKKDGVDLGEINAKLLKKIEELTLHLIEQNKEIELLKAKVSKL